MVGIILISIFVFTLIDNIMNFRKLTYLTLLLLTIYSCSNKNSEKIQISGAFALYPMMVKWAEEFKHENPGVKIDISGGGAGKGMTDVLSGMVDIGMISREIHDEEIKKGAYAFTVARDAVVATMNTQNPEWSEMKKKGLSSEKASKIWNAEYKTWGEIFNNTNQNPLNVYTRSDACGAGETWAAWMGEKQEDLKGRGVFGDPGIASAVQKDVNGIGYNNIAYAYDIKTMKPQENLGIIPIDINKNGNLEGDEDFYKDLGSMIQAISNHKYPSPPARNLYLVTKNKPTNPVVIKFIEFILTKGQSYTAENGFIKISPETAKEELKKLN